MTTHVPDSYVLKLGRAKAHLKTLNRYVTAEFKGGGGVIDAVVQKDPGLVTVTCALVQPDSTIALIAGDCLGNLRACLDHVICQIVVKHKGTSALHKQGFPICDTHEVFSNNICGEDLKGVPFHAIAAVESVQPYDRKTRNTIKDHVLSSLRRLCNTDKHRTLNIATHDLRDFHITISINGTALKPITRGGPFHPGTKVLSKPLVATSKDKVEVNAKAVHRIVFKEPPVKGVIVNKLLGQMIEHVETVVIPALKPFAH